MVIRINIIYNVLPHIIVWYRYLKSKIEENPVNTNDTVTIPSVNITLSIITHLDFMFDKIYES